MRHVVVWICPECRESVPKTKVHREKGKDLCGICKKTELVAVAVYNDHVEGGTLLQAE